jgi:hypothetical protein
MAQVPMERFEEGTELVRVYLAAAFDEARAVEATLDGAGVEYGVEVEPLRAATALGLATTRSGAGFWVRAGDLDAACAALEAAGQVRGLVLR